MIEFIGQTFPDDWFLGPHEKKALQCILTQINKNFIDDYNVVINTTWFEIHENCEDFIRVKNLLQKNKSGNLFLISLVDPTWAHVLEKVYALFYNYKIYKIGNFSSDHSLHFLSVIWANRFKKYENSDLILKNIKYKFISYSRKPQQHRIDLYQKFYENDLLNLGIATLGKTPQNFYNINPNNFYNNLDENLLDYIQHGHWYNDDPKENYGIPHDIFSLGKIDIWQNHFLNVVNETLPNIRYYNKNQELIITEKTLKPIIGLRPFIINGDIEIYDWLRQRGFKTFNDYFPIKNIENSQNLHEKIIEILLWLKVQSNEYILQLYNEMLPDLIHNRNRFFEFAAEEKLRLENIFSNNSNH